MNRALRIDVAFDFICPWCLIGKRQLELAVSQLQEALPQQVVSIDWRGVQLLPQLPAAGVPFAEFYRQRLGSDTAVRLRQAQVQEEAAAVGLQLDFSRIARMPNTADAHRLLRQAGELGSPEQRERLLERLFAAHFQLGEDIGDGNTLLTIAETCGYPREAMARALYRDGRPFLRSGMTASSVPHFVFDGSLQLSGAHPAELLLRGMRTALGQPQRRSLQA
ncbi:disulfide bond formation protein DsbA [Pseudomonas alcaligenes]|uniref:Disulfide bond formation protein DsbA n=1 Tax=Aquipseudomonas alcaligenes TaxID=43263 RepID=A0ABR7S516_AQUAC|nr:DsbA family oxidoreductase [Pseudomonas alcaligenes]MBC9251488.1 disulfide bond formation protein DsbA [Pseudomonas alcaligenes]